MAPAVFSTWGPSHVVATASSPSGLRWCPNGAYSDTVDGVSDARPDGYHLSPDGEDAVATTWLGPQVLKTAGAIV
jgi:hypothetical protein